MQNIIQDLQKNVAGFANMKVQALLLERSLLSRSILLEQAQGTIPQKPEPQSIEAYKRGIKNLTADARGRLPAEVYSYGFIKDEYECEQFDLDLIAAQRACFRYDNPFFTKRYANSGFDKFAMTFGSHVKNQSEYVNNQLDFSALKPIVRAYLARTYRFGIVGVKLSGIDVNDYAAVSAACGASQYESKFVCIDDKLYYCYPVEKRLIPFEHPEFMALLKGETTEDKVYSSFDEFPDLFSAIGGPVDELAQLKTRIRALESQLLPQLNSFAAALAEENPKVETMLRVIYPAYQAYQRAINENLESIYPPDYLLDIKFLPLAQQIFYCPSTLLDKIDDTTSLKAQQYLGDLVITLASKGLSQEQQEGSFSLSLNDVAFDTLDQDTDDRRNYKHRVETWYTQNLGYSKLEFDQALTKNKLALYAAYNVVIGRMQILKFDLFKNFKNHADYGEEIKVFEDFIMRSMKPVISSYLSGEMAQNRHFVKAAEATKQKHGDAVLEIEEETSLQYFMPAFAVYPQAKVFPSQTKLKMSLIILVLGVSAAALGVLIPLGGLGLIIGGLLLASLVPIFWKLEQMQKPRPIMTQKPQIERQDPGANPSLRQDLSATPQSNRSVFRLWTVQENDQDNRRELPRPST